MSESAAFGQPENPYASPVSPNPQWSEDPAEDQAIEELRAFVGRNSDYYLKKWAPRLQGAAGTAGMNWAAFFLGGIWLLYRKMYKFALVLFGIVAALSICEEILFVRVLGMPETPPGLDRVGNFLPGIICGAFGNSWYLSHARRAIASARAQSRDNEDFLQVLSKRGGTSLVSTLGVLLFLVAFVVAFMALDVVLDAI